MQDFVYDNFPGSSRVVGAADAWRWRLPLRVRRMRQVLTLESPTHPPVQAPAAADTNEFVITNNSSERMVTITIRNGRAFNIQGTPHGDRRGALNDLTWTMAGGSTCIVVTLDGNSTTVSAGETVTIRRTT